MDTDEKRFGRGPRELTGGVDLISRYKLLAHHDFFCKRSLPVSLLDAHYLHNIVGDADIRKGEGMQLDQLVRSSHTADPAARIRQFDLVALQDAFRLQETAPVDLPPEEKGVPTVASRSRNETKDNKRKHKKHKEKAKDKEHKKHKHRHKDRNKDKDKKKDRSGHHDANGDHSKKQHEKKRKHNRDGGANGSHRHKKSKHELKAR